MQILKTIIFSTNYILMENKEQYAILFDLVKENKWDEFKENISKTDLSFDINVRDDQNNYLLTYATVFNKPDIVNLLLERGAKLDILDTEDRSILYIPIKYGYHKILELLLEANRDNIGISITDIKDKNFKIPLHYAIILKNHVAVNLLLKYNSNPNTPDINGYNSLHYAIYARSLHLCEIVLKYIVDINARCNTGETALHMACNLQLVDITKLLIASDININLQDYDHEFGALHYAVNLNHKEILMLLLNKNANPNIQDVFGNTPVHYAILENNYEILHILLESQNTKNIINLNLWNIDGKIPLHMLLEHYEDKVSSYLDIMIDRSNISLQDNDGNTCLHLLMSLNIWDNYVNILTKKKLDIVSKNRVGMRVIDLVKPKDHDKFINIVSTAYYNRLLRAENVWSTEWENICSREFDKTSDTEIVMKAFGENISDEKTKQTLCIKVIKRHIINMVQKSNEKNMCSNTSFPVTKNKLCITLSEGKDLFVCTFTGSTLDVLLGLIYLLKKHKGVCSTLSSDFIENKNLCSFYRSIGIIMNNRCEFLNFEVVWVNQKLYLIEGFFDKIRKCIDKKARFIIIPLGIEMKEGTHANYLIYDIENNIVERFEPHGATVPPGLNYNANLLDEILENRFVIIDPKIKYMKPKDFLPKIGFQLMDIYENKRKKIGDPGGFCALWAIWYVDMRLTNRDMDCKTLVKTLIRSIRMQNISIKNMIRNYAVNIITMRDKILKSVDLNINDWLNDQYTDVQIDNVLKELKYQVNQLL
jgi:ankyrin repeat protein